MTVYSHSRLRTFETCPQKFKFSYIDGLARIEESVEAFLGSRVHEVLEKLYKDLRFEKLNSLEELLRFYNDKWQKNWNENIKIVRKDYDSENYRKMGEKYLTDYYNKHKPFDATKTIFLEGKIFVELEDEEGNKYKLQGFIDRLAYKGKGVYEIHDYKTAFSLPYPEYFENDRQLALYSIAVKEKYPDAKKIDLVWHYLAYNKEIRSNRTDEQLDELKFHIIKTIKLIDYAKESGNFKPKISALCDWCEFKNLCPAWKHVNKTEQMSLEEFKEDEGVKLVDKYAKLSKQKKELLAELEPELEATKAKLIEFAKRNNIELVVGSEFQTRIKTYSNQKFPSGSDSKAKEFNKLIRDMGLLEQVSGIDQKKLLELLPFLKKEFQEKISKYLEKYDKTYVYLSKKK